MLTARRYWSIVLLFLAIFALCQGVQLARDAVQPAGAADEPTLSREEAEAARAAFPARTRVVFAGGEASDAARMAREWADYARCALNSVASLSEAAQGQTDMVIVPAVSLAESPTALAACLEAGMDVVCLGLPEAEALSGSEALCDMLGVRDIRAERTALKGIHLFAGFLLGGERVYAARPGEEARQDLPLAQPWYTLGQGTKTYAQGLPADPAGARNEELPALAWRSHYGNGQVYVLADAFVRDRLAFMGAMQAVLAERAAWLVYPVVNARVFSLVGFPVASDENDARMERVYAMSQTRLQQEVILPACHAAAARHGLLVSCFARGEGEALARCEELLTQMGGELRRDDFDALAAPGPERPVVGWREDGAILQVTGRAETHSFGDDLALLGAQTALGYTHDCYDMTPVFWPATAADEWQNVSRAVFGNEVTAGAPFAAFDRLTVSRAEARARRYLALSVETRREGDELTLRLAGFDGEAYFILRTHGEEASALAGCDVKEIEPGAYLIRATAAQATVALKHALRARLEGGR